MDAATAYTTLNRHLDRILGALDATAPEPVNAGDMIDRSMALNVWELIQTAILRAEEIITDGTGDRAEYETDVRAALTHLRPASHTAELFYRTVMRDRHDADVFAWTAGRLTDHLSRAAGYLIHVSY